MSTATAILAEHESEMTTKIIKDFPFLAGHIHYDIGTESYVIDNGEYDPKKHKELRYQIQVHAREILENAIINPKIHPLTKKREV